MPHHPVSVSRPFRVTRGGRFRLRDVDPRTTDPIRSKARATARLEKGVARLSALQEKLYAQDRWALLLIFQAMDAAGKDGAIKHVMSGVNPQGCQVHSFKAPSIEELDHDFLWRTTLSAARARPHRHLQPLVLRGGARRPGPPGAARARAHAQPLVTKHIWKERFEAINALETYLGRNGVMVRKFFLHVSKAEQRERFLSRLDEPEKNWKFSTADVREREHWDDYMAAYEDMIRHTASAHAPWYVVPADHKWFARLVVADAIVDALDSLDLRFPDVGADKRKDLAAARRALESE